MREQCRRGEDRDKTCKNERTEIKLELKAARKGRVIRAGKTRGGGRRQRRYKENEEEAEERGTDIKEE